MLQPSALVLTAALFALGQLREAKGESFTTTTTNTTNRVGPFMCYRGRQCGDLQVGSDLQPGHPVALESVDGTTQGTACIAVSRVCPTGSQDAACVSAQCQGGKTLYQLDVASEMLVQEARQAAQAKNLLDPELLMTVETWYVVEGRCRTRVANICSCAPQHPKHIATPTTAMPLPLPSSSAVWAMCAGVRSASRASTYSCLWVMCAMHRPLRVQLVPLIPYAKSCNVRVWRECLVPPWS
jgi:hypothetical protein